MDLISLMREEARREEERKKKEAEAAAGGDAAGTDAQLDEDTGSNEDNGGDGE